ncbi:MAG TPA: hypothetical protein VJ455_10705 [Ignavibacteria bacterium]|nr:hypothetical protein [Ignavibacteria bacterium]
MVEVFKTNIQDKEIANNLLADLQCVFPNCKINFDLDDCDNILRIESDKIIPEEITKVLNYKGFVCEVLE